MSGERHGWTLLLLRRGGTESRRVELRRWAVVSAVLVLVLLLLSAGTMAGLFWAERREAARTAELEREVARLTAERARVVDLATRLEEVESSYRQIVRALGGSVAPSGRDLPLPLPTAESTPDRTGAAADPEPFRPNAWPLAEPGFVTRPFGSGSDATGHPGLDVAVPLGSYVRAAGGGMVAEAGIDSIYGRYLRIAHGDGLSSLYAHNSWLFVGVGDSVEKRQVVALSGSTGRSTAPHLHFEIRRQGELVDPLQFVSLDR